MLKDSLDGTTNHCPHTSDNTICEKCLGVEFELQYCKKCIQMTNHIEKICQKGLGKNKTWTRYWRSDKGIWEDICPHGIGHDEGVHGCDGCCEELLHSDKPRTFSDFFTKTPDKEKLKVLKVVAQKANKDQKKVMEGWEERFDSYIEKFLVTETSKVVVRSFIQEVIAQAVKEEREKVVKIIKKITSYGSCSACDECPCKMKYKDGYKSALEDIINLLN